MSNKTILGATAILGAVIVLVVALNIYFSPYQTCVRSQKDWGGQYAKVYAKRAALLCARAVGGNS